MSTHAGGSSKRATLAPPTLGSKGGRIGRPPNPVGRATRSGAVDERVKAAARGIAHQSRERLLVFDRTGKVVETVQGSRNHVGGTRAQVAGRYELHNHPPHFYNTFSEQDVRFAAGAKSLATSVVQARTMVTMYPRADGTWPSYSREIAPAFRTFYTDRMESLTAGVRAGRLSNRVFDIRLSALLHATWAHVARQTGMRYLRERI